MRRAVGLVARVASYSALALLAVVAAIMAILANSGACSTLHEAKASCASPLAQGLAEFALGVTLLAAFTGLPLLFAAIGLFFLVIDIRRLRRRRAAASGA